ncbi:MAG: ComEC/Rec2 family competence protein [Lachnospiraceae bacterium]|nr:ComEC/Rec2 family competence protein [Lachnospiraceae bacterium]
MKRPWLCIAAGTALGEAAAYLLKGLWPIAILLPVLIVTGILYLNHKETDKRRAVIVMCIAFLFGILRLKISDAVYLRPSELTAAEASDNASLLLTVDDIELKGDRAVITCGQVMVYCDTADLPDLKLGNTINVSGEFSGIEAPRNPGESDFRLYYRSLGITHKCFADRIAVTGSNTRRIAQYILEVRQNMLSHISSIYDADDAGILRAALLGDKTLLDEDLLHLYQRSGFAHLLAISGLHVGILGMSLYKLLREKLKLSFMLSGITASVLISAYSILTGNGVSTVRAVLMLILVFTAGTAGRKNDMLNSAGLAAVCILCVSPYQLFSCGFLLSFSAVAAIGGPAAFIIKELDVKNHILQALVISLCVSLFSMPITAYFYFEIPLYATLINMIVIPLMTYVVWSGLAATVLSYLSRQAALIAAGSGHYILKFYTYIGILSQKLPFATITIGRPRAWQIIAYYLLFFAFLYLSPSRIRELKSRLLMSGRETEST